MLNKLVEYLGEMWGLLTIYGRSEIRLLLWDEPKWQNMTLIVGEVSKNNGWKKLVVYESHLYLLVSWMCDALQFIV